MAAKPIIDMLPEAADVADLDTCHAVISDPGHEALGEFGTPGRRYFRKCNASGIRTHHLHTFATDSPEIRRHLACWDYMPAHPEEAHRYGTFKQRPATLYPDDIEAYMDGKDQDIRDHQTRALAWQTGIYSAVDHDNVGGTRRI